MKPIDLSEKGHGLAVPMDMMEHYPCVTLREDGAYELPDEGTITFSFKKKRYEESMENGEKRYSCTLELHEIVDVKDETISEPASNKSKDAGDALDALRAEKMKDDESEDY